MPVQKNSPGEHPEVDPYRRLSASQAIAYNTCPRLWYYGWERRLKAPLPPQIIRGNAAEACICRVMRDSPALVSSTAEDQMQSPLDEQGNPLWDSEEGWPSPTMQAIDESSWPTDIEALTTWAHSRAEAHFEKCWEDAKSDWLANPNRRGTIEDADPEECLNMVIRGIDLHLREVQSCLESAHGDLEAWRRGEYRPHWPAPDGFPRVWTNPHPSSRQHGEQMHITEAWEIARPWFVDPDAAAFTQTSTHPGGWFQGEYDLVYRWGGRTRIIDLKASIGKGDRSHGYIDQLRMYAWLWNRTHGDSEPIDGLEIWYLGAGEPKPVPIPSPDEMNQMELDLHSLYKKIRKESPSMEECPPSPSPLRRFQPGGVPDKIPVEQDPKARCRRCEYRGICEGSDAPSTTVQYDKLQRLGHDWTITPIDDIQTRFSAVGEVSKLLDPKLGEDGTVDVRFTLVDGWDRATVRPHRLGGPKKVTRSLSEGSRVRVDGALPSLWKGQLNLDLDSKSQIKVTDEDDRSPIVEIETRVSVVGKVWSIDAYPDGVSINRWAITLVDTSGSASAVAFKQFIPTKAASISRGDVIGILNGEVGEWGGRPQIKMGPGTKVVVISNDGV